MKSQSISKTSLIPPIEPGLLSGVIDEQFEPDSLAAQAAVKPGIRSEEIWKPYEVVTDSESDYAAWFSMTYDLLHSFDELASSLRHSLQQKSWLNAFLLAAGMNQITEDYLHSDPLEFSKAAKMFGKLRSPVGPFLASTAWIGLRMWGKLNELIPSVHTTIVWQRKLAEFTARIAEVVIDANPVAKSKIDEILNDGIALLDTVKDLPASLKKEICRLPSCFRSFDQQPEDLSEMARNFSERWPDRQKLIAVIGIRTSGSFLAPLIYANLNSLGYQHVELLTIRPGTTLLKHEKSLLKKIIREDGLALLCDDPPISGSTMFNAAAQLEREGISASSIILMMQLFGDSATRPVSLQKYPAVLLEWADWSIHRKLKLNEVEDVLSDALSPTMQIVGLDRIPDFPRGEDRQHISALYMAKVEDLDTNLIFARLIRVKGVGLGYFGEHAAAVSQKLSDFAAPTITLREGLIYQQIMPTSQPLSDSSGVGSENLTESLVNYIIERSRQLAVQTDRSLRLCGRNAVWEVASNLLSQAFGRAWFLVRLPIVDPYIKKTLTALKPSVVDGDMSLRNWYLQVNGKKHLIKLNLAERDFSHQDLYSYDPVYDLACLNLDFDADDSGKFRIIYELLTNEKISPARWMLYQLVHLWDLSRLGMETDARIYRKKSRVVQSYFSEVYFQDLNENPTGPLCAFDIDGVLETGHLGFSSLSPASARSLRALNLHGYRVLLATGRSLGEVKERCEQYHLTGGAAEYGAVIYDHASDQTIALLTDEETRALEQLRSKLSDLPGICIDTDYIYSVRAFRLDENKQRKGLSDKEINQIIAETGMSDEIYAAPGKSQTDFLPKRINKGLGLSQWVLRFDPELAASNSDKPIEFAVGDSISDLPMLALAKLAVAPASASREVEKAGIKLAKRPYQLGLEQAVATFLGHSPEGCSLCVRKTPETGSSYMEDILSAQENGMVSMVLKSIKLLTKKRLLHHVSEQ